MRICLAEDDDQVVASPVLVPSPRRHRAPELVGEHDATLVGSEGGVRLRDTGAVWAEHIAREIRRYEDGEARLPPPEDADERQRQLTRMGNAAAEPVWRS